MMADGLGEKIQSSTLLVRCAKPLTEMSLDHRRHVSSPSRHRISAGSGYRCGPLTSSADMYTP